MLQLALLFPRYSLPYALSAAPQGIKQQCPLGSEVPSAPPGPQVCVKAQTAPQKQ